jgi:threonine/homoserine/homoserine lactone efflux protein
MIVNNLADNFGVLADTVEVVIAVIMIVGGIYITYAIQKWADRAGEPPPADNQGLSGAAQPYEPNTIRG